MSRESFKTALGHGFLSFGSVALIGLVGSVVIARIYGVDVIPGTWTLEVELNPGERVSLPCVDRVDDLYERVEAARAQLGS